MDQIETSEEETEDPRRWKKAGWIACVVKNEDDEGWAVTMTRVGDSEPALVTPWTMGRDKKNPKPIDHHGFATLVKGATEVLRRHTEAARERLHRELTCTLDSGHRVRADLDIAQDEDDPHAVLAVIDLQTTEILRTGRIRPDAKLNEQAVRRFVRTGEA